MSLLLEALRSTDSSVEATIEPEEEPLNARATLALLAPKSVAQGTLSLVPASDIATPAPSAPAPPLVEDIAPAAPIPARAELVTPPPLRATAKIASAASAAVAVPATMPRIKKYALLVAALVAAAGIGLIGKSLWRSNTNTVIYPAGSEAQQAVPSTDHAPAPSTGAVQVSSARPAEQFAYAGNAPEIDLSEPDADPAAAPVPMGTAPWASATPAASAATVAGASPRTRPARAQFSAATLSVTRSEGPSPIDRHVQAGYRALAAGNLANAQREYLAGLELDPSNVDALMGVATVAARDGRTKFAADAYAKVLKLEPGNPDATAAMAMLGSSGSAGESNESRLKILIAGDDGGRPALHAALAGVYSADARWTEAAQEYFTALGRDPGNPDLAFNVAASLDQNRNYAMALKYYRQAVAFAGQRPAQIDLRALDQRISQLQARVEAPAPSAPGTP